MVHKYCDELKEDPVEVESEIDWMKRTDEED